MDDFCRQFFVCSLIPLEWHWVMPIIVPLIFLIIIGIPVAKILHQAGYSRWWTILAIIPVVNLISLWVFAFLRWPRTR